MKITDCITLRRSRRTFIPDFITSQDKNELTQFFNELNSIPGNEIVNFTIIERKPDEKKMKLEYGIIRGHHTYILGKTKFNQESRINYGYMMEKIVLKATEMNIATCWVGYFDKNYFNEISIENGYDIPSIVIIGYSEKEHSFPDKVARFVVSASKRKDWDKLFFDYQSQFPLSPEKIGKYVESLEMLRLAPSSGNTQPWKVYYDINSQEFHFFKKSINKWYEARGLHDIDMGIALCHFELTSIQNGLKGEWIRLENLVSFDGLQYIMTWKCK